MKKTLVALLAFLVVCLGCDRSHQTVTTSTGPASVSAVSIPLLDSNDFDLATVAELIRDGKVQDANTLQSIVNDPSSGINNVDVDKDGLIDPITVVETPTANGKQFDLTANPATRPAIVVASVNLAPSNGQVVVQAGYPTYVNGYQDNYYTYNAVQNLAFLMWAMGPRPVFIPQPIVSYGWSARPVMVSSQVVQQRTSYTTQTRVSPIPKSAPPANFTTRATRVPSGYPSQTTRTAPTTNNLNDRAVVKDFKARDPADSTPRATRFVATPGAAPAPKAPAPVAAPAPKAPPSTPSFKTSRPSGPRTRK